MERFEGRRAVVTGAARGIGLAIARRLADEGAAVLLMDVDRAAGRAACAMLAAAGLRADFQACDVGDPAAVAGVARAVADRWGGLDFLVNNAGIFPRAPACETPVELWDAVLRTNLGGAFHCVKHLVPLMASASGAAVVNIASGRALAGAVNGAAYSASKAGLLGLTRSLALEFAPRGIRVNAVVPGITDTAQPRQGMSEEAIALAGERVPLGRIGQPLDVARAVAFLLSEDAGYITGHTLVVNGGSIML